MTKRNRSVYQANEDARDKYQTRDNSPAMFPLGTTVMIICHGQDHHFFYNELGTVTDTRRCYLGITVTFDKPRHFDDGYIQKGFSFDPDDLVRLADTMKYCMGCRHKLATSKTYCSMGLKMINKRKCKHRHPR